MDTCSNCCFRNVCCCCLDDLEDKYLLDARTKALVKEPVVPAPEDINWESF
jgi:hypothetical protein